MKNNLAICLLIGIFLTPVLFAEAQQAKIPKIGWLGARTPSGPGGGPGTGAESFRREFGKLGYVEGKNIAIEYRYADDQLDRLPGLAEELIRLKIDLLIAPTTVEARAAKNATRTIPIVFFNVPDPVSSGLVASLARPGGNLTGLSSVSQDLAGKRLELLKETIPKLESLSVLPC
jgi:putative tryptophan/tyrosine transport system substrate-binding protein